MLRQILIFALMLLLAFAACAGAAGPTSDSIILGSVTYTRTLAITGTSP